MEFKDIKKLVELMKTNELSEFELEDGEFRLLAKRGGDQAAPVYMQSPMAPPMHAAAPAAPADAGADGVVEAAAPVESIDSPMVGTFYKSPSPESDAYVTVGQQVDADTVVCIIEAMKVMNEIKAERSGFIKRLLIDNATPVEFGQPLFEIDPV